VWIVLSREIKGITITKRFILIIASIYLLKIVVIKLEEFIIWEYHNIRIINLPEITETQWLNITLTKILGSIVLKWQKTKGEKYYMNLMRKNENIWSC
jgi:hypothetical protein